MPQPAPLPENTPHSERPRHSTPDWLAGLLQPARMGALSPIAARFALSLRLIVVHERAQRDPVPELAARLGNLDVVAKSLALAQVITLVWPEDVCTSRFCCPCLTHDEATIGALVECAQARDRAGFDARLDGFIRRERIALAWEATQDLVNAEMQAA